MPTVIRATDRNAGIHPVAFNFSDIADEANQRLDTFRVEAEAILDAARREAGQIRKQAEIDGRRAAEEIILRELSAPDGHALAGPAQGDRGHPPREAGVAEPLGKERGARGGGDRRAADPPRVAPLARNHARRWCARPSNWPRARTTCDCT